MRPITAEVINLNDKKMIKVMHGRYLVGYFYTPADVDRRLKNMGHSLADVEIRDDTKVSVQE